MTRITGNTISILCQSDIERESLDLQRQKLGYDLDAHRLELDYQHQKLALQIDSEKQKLQLEFEERFRQLDARLQQMKTEAKERQTAAEARTNVLKLRWSVDRIRSLVSILLVVGFLSMSGLVIVLGAFGTATTDLLQNVTALYSGVTGAILGYYFGRQQP
jgi:hypothetical protein